MQADTTFTDLRWNASCMTMPYDVLVECILVHLPVCALIACHLVCKGLHKAAKKALENAAHTFVAQTEPFLVSCKHQEVILSAFEYGTETFLHWIETVMKYPLFASEPVDLECCARRIAARGDISILEYFWDTIQKRQKRQNGDEFDCCQYFIHVVAAQHGHLHILQWARDNRLVRFTRGPDPHYAILSIALIAASAGQLHVLQWLDENDVPLSQVISGKKAAANGHIPVLEWLLDQPSAPVLVCKNGITASIGLEDVICASSCSSKDTTTLKWALSNGFPFVAERCLVKAISKGNVPMAEHIRTISASMSPPPNLFLGCDHLLVHRAIKSDSVEMLRWLHDQVPVGYFQSRDSLGSVVSFASGSASLEVLKWTLANGYSPSAKAVHVAAVSNQAQNLRWMLQDGRFVLTDNYKGISEQTFLQTLTLDTMQALADHGLAVPTELTIRMCKLNQAKRVTDSWTRRRVLSKGVRPKRRPLCF